MNKFILLYEQDFYSCSDQVIPVFGHPECNYSDIYNPVITKEEFDRVFERLKNIENPKRAKMKHRLEMYLKHNLWWDKRQPDYDHKTRRKIKLLKILRKDILHNPHIKVYLEDWVFELIPMEALKYNIIHALLGVSEKNPR